MTNYTNGYQWFQVAELGYDSFMVRHSRLIGLECERPRSAAPGRFRDFDTLC
jgi:hypothetical protein